MGILTTIKNDIEEITQKAEAEVKKLTDAAMPMEVVAVQAAKGELAGIVRRLVEYVESRLPEIEEAITQEVKEPETAVEQRPETAVEQGVDGGNVEGDTESVEL